MIGCHHCSSSDLGIRRHVGLQLVARIVHLDLDAVDQLHALFLRLDLLGRELRLRGDERDAPVVDLARDTNRWSASPSDPSFTRPRSVSLM